jgi:hypothetical protein
MPVSCAANTISLISITPGFPFNMPPDCYADIKIKVNLASGWTVNGGSDTLDYFAYVNNSTAALVPITVYLTDSIGDTCSISETIAVACNNGTPFQGRITNNNYPQPVQASIKIYPNPTVGEITIASTDPNINSVEVFDIAGKKLEAYQFANINEAHISIAEYAAGTYLIKVNNSIKQIINKIR